jgi:hypothetical protein
MPVIFIFGWFPGGRSLVPVFVLLRFGAASALFLRLSSFFFGVALDGIQSTDILEAFDRFY